MKKALLSLLAFATYLTCSAQTIKDSKLEEDSWGWHNSLINWRCLASHPCGIKDGLVYIKATPTKFLPHDSLYCYDPKTEQFTGKTSLDGGILLTDKYNIKQFKFEFEKESKVWKLDMETFAEKTLEKKSTKNILTFDLPKGTAYNLYRNISADSSKYINFLSIEVEKDVRRQYCIVYDRQTDEITKRELEITTKLPYYIIDNVHVTNEGDPLLTIRSYDKDKINKADNKCIEIQLFTESNVEKTYRKIEKGESIKTVTAKELHDGRIFWAALTRTDKESYLYHSMTKKSDIEDCEVKRYEFSDMWKEHQKTSLTKYSQMDIDYVQELDNGKIVLSGFPYSIITTCTNNSCVNKNWWGGFYVMTINKENDVENCNLVERRAKKLNSLTASLQEMNIYYDAFTYGNDFYLMFNESTKKIEKGNVNAFYKIKDKEGYIMLYKLDEDGKSELKSISGSTASQRIYNRYLGHDGNKFYVLTRNNDLGSVSTIELPAVSTKDFTRRETKKTIATTEVKKSTPAEKTTTTVQSSRRKRTVKR